jgi:hypothetical protein
VEEEVFAAGQVVESETFDVCCCARDVIDIVDSDADLH